MGFLGLVPSRLFRQSAQSSSPLFVCTLQSQALPMPSAILSVVRAMRETETRSTQEAAVAMSTKECFLLTVFTSLCQKAELKKLIVDVQNMKCDRYTNMLERLNNAHFKNNQIKLAKRPSSTLLSTHSTVRCIQTLRFNRSLVDKHQCLHTFIPHLEKASRLDWSGKEKE